MGKTWIDGPVPRPIDLRLKRLVVKLGKAFVRLAEPDRQRVMRLTEEFSTGKTSTASHSYPWSKADIERCYLQLQPISQKMADDFHSWASEYRETEHLLRSAFRSRIAELVRRKRREKR